MHPDSGDASCRTEEIARYWSTLATEAKTIIGGDFNHGHPRADNGSGMDHRQILVDMQL
jgi:hypothetical protein